MEDITEDRVKNRMIDKINKNGHDPESISVVQKARDAWLCTVTFADDDREYVGIVTRDELAQP